MYNSLSLHFPTSGSGDLSAVGYRINAGNDEQCKPSSIYGAKFIEAFTYGSGSLVPVNLLRSIYTTGGAVFDLYDIQRSGDRRLAAIGVKDQLSIIRLYLGVSVSDLASIMKVERPTIYKWASGASPRHKKLVRLNAVEEIAMEWRALSSAPLAKHIKTQVEGNNLLDLLTEAEINRTTVSQILRLLSSAIPGEPASKKRRLAMELREKGYLPLSESEQVNNIRSIGLLVSDE